MKFSCIEVHENVRVDPVQTPRSAASEQGLHCLHMSPNEIPGLKGIVRVDRPVLVVLPMLSSMQKSTFY